MSIDEAVNGDRSPSDTKTAVPETRWTLKSIKWKQVWRRQDHANMLLTTFLIVWVAISSFVFDPRIDNYYVYDGTISQPAGTKRGFQPTVPNWAAVIIPALMMFCTIVVGEFFYSRREHRLLTDAFAVTVYFLLDGIQSLACALLVTQATKVAVGTLRPDFLARCAPIIQPPDNFTIQYGQITTAEYPCTGNADDIKEGRQSFPSGHSAFSFNLAAYASSYLLWCWNMRRAWVPKILKPWQEFLSDLGNVVAKLWLLIMLGVAWGISMSRIIDNQHHPADVVGGMLVGVLVALIYILRSIPRYKRVVTAVPVPSHQISKRQVEVQSVQGGAAQLESQSSGRLVEEEEGRAALT